MLGWLGIYWQSLRRQPAAQRVHIGIAELLCNSGHAIGRLRFAQTVFPGAQLRIEVIAWQAQQARYRGLGSHQCAAMALHTSRDLGLRFATLG